MFLIQMLSAPRCIFIIENCSRKCVRCSSGLSCVHDNGVCQYGCETGYEGTLYQTGETNSITLVDRRDRHTDTELKTMT